MSELQLEMNFSPRGNRLQQALDRAEFVLFIEHAAPAKDNDPAAAADRLRALEQAALEQPLNCALAITDCRYPTAAWHPVEYASGLSPENRDRHLVYLGGRGESPQHVTELLQLARANTLTNLVVTSGDAVPGEDRRATRRHVFTDSLNLLERTAGEFHTGVVVNPFCYTPWSLVPQYRKLVRKFAAGAAFAVTQAGWDMLKLQSLRWYLCERDLFYPTIARLVLLTPEKVDDILSGEIPGVTISPDFRAILEKELRFSRTQFEAAQYRRLELQVAGCRLLGFSGVQLLGVEQPARIRLAAERIGAALEEFTDFGSWLESYNSYLARTEMAPRSRSYALYDRVLHRPYADGPLALRDFGPVQVSRAEKLKYHLRKFFFAHADSQGSERLLLKKLLAGCRNCHRPCRLPRSAFVCPAECPKNLEGPCGGLKLDGSCEVPGVGECVFHRIARIAHWRGELEQMP